MANSIYKILVERFWAEHSNKDKIRLFQILITWCLVALFVLMFFVVNRIFFSLESCIVCDFVLISLCTLAIICTLNGRINCSLNVIFSMPLVIYAYYISDFNTHPPIIETTFSTVGWLLAGLVFLLYFSNSDFKTTAYYSISLLTIGLQLFKSDILFDSFTYFSPAVTHPMVVFSVFFVVTIFLRKKYMAAVEKQEQLLYDANQGISKVFQDSANAIAQVNIERDENKNILEYKIAKVNNSFESVFKINLYEVQDQVAAYIFNLVFKTHFNFKQIIELKANTTKEYHAKKLDRWFKIDVIRPNSYTAYIVLEDITKAKKKLADLESSKKRYKVLLEAIPDMFSVIDKDGTYEDFVIKEGDLFKIEDANIIGSTIYDVGFPEKMADLVYTNIQKTIQTNSLETIEYSLNTPNGTFLYEMRLAKLNNHAVISVSRDVTKRKTAEFELEKALVRAEESDRLKSAFLSNLSHEIKTPMNVITNLTRILADTNIPSSERLILADGISENGNQLMNMIDNTIHLSKIETNTVELNMLFSPVNQILRDVYNYYYAHIPDSKPVKIRLDLDAPNKDFGFVTDAEILKDTITLLVDNALKYTLAGEVTFGYEMIQNKMVRFYVNDSGIGIPEEEQENIFNRFYRIQNKINTHTSGSGNGLAIAQHYVELLGGELNFESVENKGTKFLFTIPFKDGKGFLSLAN